MIKTAILTATYNRPDELSKLYLSLKNQIDKDFTWCIVNDGSKKNIDKQIDEMILENSFEILYFAKQNGGKSSAISYGLDRLMCFDFVLFVDDDELLFPDATKIVKEYGKKYMNTDCAVIHFNRKDENDNIIAKPIIYEDQIMHSQERKRKNYHQDGYTGYFVSKLNNTRFPKFENEKYVGPSVLFMLVCRKYQMVWASAVIGKTAYLKDGLTNQGRELRVKNPKGMFVHALLMQNKKSGLWLRWVYSILGYAYIYYANLKEVDIRHEIVNIDERLIVWAKPFARILSLYWKIKYKK